MIRFFYHKRRIDSKQNPEKGHAQINPSIKNLYKIMTRANDNQQENTEHRETFFGFVINSNRTNVMFP